MEIVIVDKVSKKFSRNHHEAVRYGLRSICRDFLGINDNHSLTGTEFLAVNDVSFTLNKGESLGVIGVNGSGKTTLLKMISGIINPDHGSIKTKGKIIPLFAKGAGFDPILTGFENINLNLSLLGLNQNEIDNVLNDIISFAELNADILSSPVKTYSSGMLARLGFSCAVHAKPEILIVDEALAVGDMRFRTKCYRKLNELKSAGCSLILVSHSTSLILANCTKGLFLKNGVVKDFGDIEKVVKSYENTLELSVSSNGMSVSKLNPDSHRTGLSITSLELKNHLNETVEEISSAESAKVLLNIFNEQDFENLNATLIIKDLNSNLENILDLSSMRDKLDFSAKKGSHLIEIDLPVVNIAPGKYILKAFISQHNLSNILDVVESFLFTVTSDEHYTSMKFYQPRNWSIKHLENNDA